uniref:Uncharacterized protein n=1 Tax=Romanomermis culicivorax TaxID=13658 RepID=A0A915I5L4_ROMCU
MALATEIIGVYSKFGLRLLCGIGWTAEILPICSLSILSLEPDAILGIVDAGFVGITPKACGLRDAGGISACELVEAVCICLVRLRLMVRALLPITG